MKKVLIVEDEFQISQTVRELLEGVGYKAKCASHGGEALEALESFSADLIILDFVMPVMSGLELISQLQTRGFDRPIVMMSAVQDLPQFETRSVISYLPKPFTVERLFEVTKAALGTAHKEGEGPTLRQI